MRSTLFRSVGRRREAAARSAAPALAIQALEPRVLLDAAAAQTAQEAAQEAAQASAALPPADARDHDELVAALGALDRAEAAQARPPAGGIYFIDLAVPEADRLAASLPAGAEVHFIAADADGAAYIAETLRGRSGVGAVHLLGHGEAGSLRLGDATLTLQSMQGEHRDELAAIASSLSAEADILIYGCDFGAGETGAQAVEMLAALTGADVAASSDATGAERFGGDWALEVEAGAIEAAALSAPQWDHLMAPAVLSIGRNAVVDGSFEGNAAVWMQEDGTSRAERHAASSYGLSAVVDGENASEVEGAVGSRYIEQSVSGLAPGQTYTLSWYGHTRINGSSTGADLGRAVVRSGGAEIASLDFETGRNGWQRFSLSFTAPADGTVTLRFQSRGSTGSGSATDGAGLIVDAVRLDQPAYATGYTENAQGVAIASADSMLVDLDSANQRSLTVRITNPQAGDLLGVSGNLPAAITASYDAATATLTLSGNASKADYLAALKAVRYSSSSEAPSGATRLIEVVANDGSADSNKAMSEVAVAAENDAPVLDSSTELHYAAQEDAPVPSPAPSPPPAGWTTPFGVPVSSFTGGISDADADAKRGIAIIGNAPEHGVWWYTINGGTTWQQVGAVSDGSALLLADDAQTRLYFQSTTADYNGSGGASALTLRAWDQTSGTAGTKASTAANGGTTAFSAATDTVSVTIGAVEDAPRIDLDGAVAGTDHARSLDQGTVPIGNLVSVTDPDGQNLASMTITLDNAGAADRLFASGTLPVGLTGSYDAATGVYTLSGDASPDSYQAALGQIRFATTSGATAERTVRVVGVSSAGATGSNEAVARITPIDSDGDGVANTADIDDDNDGLLDTVEIGPPANMIDNPDFTAGYVGFDSELEDPLNGSYSDWNGVVANGSTGGNYTATWNPFGATGGTRPPGSGAYIIVNDLSTAQQESQTSALIWGQALNVQPGQDLRFDFQMAANGVSLDVRANGVSLTGGPQAYSTGGLWTDQSFGFATGDASEVRLEIWFHSPWSGGGDVGLDNFSVLVRPSDTDTDTDGIVDRLDIDADNDGITDNVEAQATRDYKAPSGQGAAMTDVDDDGLDDTYDADTGAASTSATSLGLMPVDTDGDAVTDHLDADSDDDGMHDIAERGAGPTSVTSTADTDRDGLLDIFEGGNAGDGFDANDENLAGTGFTLADSDDDTAPDGADAAPRTTDLDYRDNAERPAIDLDADDSSGATQADHAATYVEGGAAVAVVDTDVAIVDGDSTQFASARVALTNAQAGDRLLVGGSADASGTLASGIAWTRTDETVTFSGAFGRADYETALRMVSFMSTSAAPVAGVRTLAVSVNDGTSNSNTATARIEVVAVNDAPSGTDNTVTVAEDTSHVFTVADFGFGDAADTPPNALQAVVITTLPASGALVFGTTPVTAGQVIAAADVGQLRWTPPAGQSGTGIASFTFQVRDDGGTANGGADTDPSANTITFDVTPVDDAPSNTVPGAQDAREDTALAISGISVADADSPSLTSTVSVAHGTLSVETGGGATITGNGGASVTLSGSAAQINAALAGLRYTPAADYHGTDTLTLSTSDGNLVDRDTVAITVAPEADIADDTAATDEDQPVTIDVLANDSFEDTARTITRVNDQAIASGGSVAVANGTVTLTVDGRLRFTPAANFNGPASFTYTVGAGGTTETATVKVDVKAVNDAPVPADPSPSPTGQRFDPATGDYAASLAEDTDFSGNVAAQDADGDPLSYVVTTPPAHGTVIYDDPSGYYLYTPAPDYHGEDSFEMTISDDQGGSVRSVVRMTVTPVADIADDTAATDEDQAVTIDVLANDSFEDTARTISRVNDQAIASGGSVAVADGTVTLMADGTLRFTPATNFNGPARFDYTVSAGGATETATVNVDVKAVNDVPVPVDPSPSPNGQRFDPATGDYAASLAEDTAFSGSVAAQDADGDTLSYSITTPPAHGTVMFDEPSGEYLYTPALDYHGEDSFEVTASDGKGGSVRSVVRMTVTPVADIADDTAATDEDQAVTIDVLANDSFEDAARTITRVNDQAIASGGSVAVANGTVTLTADGTLRFTPATNFNGPASFDYTVSAGGATETATVNVDVKAVNDAPVPVDPSPSPNGQRFDPATGDYAASLAEDTAFSGSVAAQDADGDTLSYSITTPPAHGTVMFDEPSGEYLYTPALDYHGEDSFEVTASDGKGGSVRSVVRMTVTPVADIADDTAATDEDQAVTIDVLANDSFEDAARTITRVNDQAIASGGSVAVANGTVTLTADGRLRFTPAANFNGSARFDYTVSAGGAAETATVEVDVKAVNDAPSNTIPGAQDAREDTALAISGISVADADSTSLTSTVSVAHGTLSVEAGGGATITTGASVTLSGSAAEINAALAGLRYTPAADYHGTDTLTLSTSDGSLDDRDTVAITVAPVADIADDTAATDEDQAVTIDVLGNDSFEDSGRALTHVDGQAIASGGTVAVADGSVTRLADGSLRFTPTANFNGPASFTYTVSAGGTTETATVNVDVKAVNDAPVPVDPSPSPNGQRFDPATGDYAASLAEDSAFSGSVAAQDADGDTLSYSITTPPAHGTVMFDEPSGEYLYTPALDYHGEDSFEVTASDGKGGSVRSVVRMTVTPVADIADDTAATDEDQSVTIDVLANDSFEDTARTITRVNDQAIASGGSVAVANGTVTLTADGRLRFTPTANFNGPARFDYTVSAGGATETATVNVGVKAGNDAPSNTMPGAQEAREDTALAISGISVADADSTSLTSTVSVAHGTLSVEVGGGATITGASVTLSGSAAEINAALAGLRYTPAADYHGTDTLALSTSDGNLVDRDTVAITVAPVADIVDDIQETQEDQSVTIDVLANDSFEDASRTITRVNDQAIASGGSVAVANGTVTLTADGRLRFTPAANFNGPARFTYTVSAGGTTEMATVEVDVKTVNDAPSNTVPGAQDAREDTALAISGISVADADSSLTSTVSVAHGTLSVEAGGGATITGNGDASVTLSGSAAQINAALAGLRYAPAADYHGADMLTLSTSDGSLDDRDTVAITVAPEADIADDTAATDEDQPVTIDVLANDSFEDTARTITRVNDQAIASGGSVAVANGTVTLTADGRLRFTPAANFNGPARFGYTVEAGGLLESAEVRLDVLAVNDLPVPSEPDRATPGQTFDPATGSYTVGTRQEVPVDGQVGARDPDGDPLAYALGEPPRHGTVTVDPLTGRYTYTPAPGFHGDDSFVVAIDDGRGGVVRATVRVRVTAAASPAEPAPAQTGPAAPAEPPPRRDHPFVNPPGPRPGEPARDDGGLPRVHAEPAVLEAVGAARSLRGMASLEGRGAVVQAVNGVGSLGSIAPPEVRGVVLEAVNRIDPLDGGDRSDKDRFSSWRLHRWEDGSVLPAAVSSLVVGGGMGLELGIEGDRAWLTTAADDTVREIRVTLPDGGPVPDWVRVDARGFVAIDRPAGVEQLRLRVILVDSRGNVRSEAIEIDFDAGQLRRAPGHAEPAAPAGGPSAHAPAAPSFSQQLEQALRARTPDAELLELLG